jgi:hypothetical protein
MPTSISTNGSDVTISGATGTNSVVVKVQQGHTFNGNTNPGFPSTPQTVNVKIGDKCNATGTGFATTSTNPTPRAVAAGFNVEGANSLVPQCQES